MYKLIVKRFLDIVISIFLFPFFLMFLIPVSILILVEDRGAIFYLAERIGKNKVPFKMIKFRSMKVNSPDIRLSDGSTYNSKKDSRVTKIGKIIRELSIDELPQILNVLIGDMSLIGPRPDVFSQEEYPEEYISFKCLTGDKGDNVDGFSGIGPKRAESLIKEYGSAMDIYEILPIDSKYKFIQGLNENPDKLLLNYELMDLITYCDDAIGSSNLLDIEEKLVVI